MRYSKRYAMVFCFFMVLMAIIFSNGLSLIATMAFYLFLYAFFFMEKTFLNEKLFRFLILLICFLYLSFNLSTSLMIYDNLLYIILYNLKTVIPFIKVPLII